MHLEMKNIILLLAILTIGCSRDEKNTVIGTWRLQSAQMITGKDTVQTYPVAGQEMIKIINDSHFAFLRHDVDKGKKSGAMYDSGGGTYTLDGNTYIEKLEYCAARGWEGHTFKFEITHRNDTLIQKGIERIDSLNINREITEVYTRIK
jgi:hypothetical protein